MELRHGSLFSGIGGFDLAAEWMEWENVFHVEKEAFLRKILNYYWPNAESYADIKKTCFKKYRHAIDILTGGFPCQPFSNAGKRMGTEDDRNLWPEMFRAVREIAPTFVVAENVSGLINWEKGIFFEQILSDLEGEGYAVQPLVLPAHAVDAPHLRDRLWIVAYSDSNRRRVGKDEQISKSKCKGTTNPCVSGQDAIVTNPKSQYDTEYERGQKSGSAREFGNGIKQNVNSDSNSTRRQKQHTWPKPAGTGFPARFCYSGTSPNSIGIGQRGKIDRNRKPKQLDENGQTSHWQNFPTEPPVCGGNDGLSLELDGITPSKFRRETIKAYGNAVVPQLVYEIFMAIQTTYENEHNIQ